MDKKGGFWDNPFGGIFDLDGDGIEDYGEQWLGYMILEECTKEDNESAACGFGSHRSFDTDSSEDTSWRDYCEDGSDYDLDPEDYETEDEYNEALDKVKNGWKETCEDGSDYGLDPEDYETEEEYNEALDEAKNGCKETCEDGSGYGLDPEDYETEEEYNEAHGGTTEETSQEITLQFSIEWPALDTLEAIKESDYPNKRRYNAAYTLANEFIGYCDAECKEKEKACCQFIVDKADTILAANYLAHDEGFLYAQAIKDNFELPISLPDEDETSEIAFTEILCKIAKRDIPLSFKVWEWSLERFLPYVQYCEYAASELTNEVIDNLYGFPDDYELELVRYLDANPDFFQKIMEADSEPMDAIPEFVAIAIREQLFGTAQALFANGIAKANNKWKEIIRLTNCTIDYCQNNMELESIEYFRDTLFPYIKAIDDGMVRDKIEEWETDMSEYIDRVESECEQYAYTRKNAWRKRVPDGKEYDLDPRYFDNEQEYLKTLEEEKYEWRQWYNDSDNCGLDPNAFETEEEFSQALNARMEDKRRSEREERQRQRQAPDEPFDPAVLDDKTVYIYCGVVLPFSNRPYHYRTEDPTIKIGDTVLVPVGNKEAKGTVVSVGQYARIAVPFPIEKTKFIIGPAES